MRQLITDIKTQLKDGLGFAYVAVWNNQLDLLEGQEQYAFPFPAAFVEIINNQPIKQLGDGLQLYDPLTVRIHICHFELDAGDGTLEENMEVFDYSQATYKKMQRFEPDGAVAFCRVNEERDYTHGNVYHMLQDYGTNYVDASGQTSTDGTTIAPGTLKLKFTANYSMAPYLKGKGPWPTGKSFNTSFNLSFK